jgi:hypothetical protein
VSVLELGFDPDEEERRYDARLAANDGRAVSGRLPVPVDWATFWQRGSMTGEFLLEPLIPAGRAVAMYALAKSGKSLLNLECAAKLAAGRAVLGQPARAPISVVYMDMEMTEDDLRNRLEDLGFGADDDLSNLHYFLLPTLPPLDNAEGGAAMTELCAVYEPHLVIIDTMGRTIVGRENEADTFRGFYRHTGARLKAAGIASVRLDHEGKDTDRGQRGSSAKAEDVDLVWHLTADGPNVKLRVTHKRIPWVPDQLHLKRVTEPHVAHHVVPRAWPKGTADVAALLDQLDVPTDATTAHALDALRAAGEGRRTEVVTAALRQRKDRP